MSGSARKRKSLWDSKDEMPHPASEKSSWDGKESYSSLGNDPKWSSLESDVAPKAKDHPILSSKELSEGSYGQKNGARSLNDISETRRVWDGDKSYLSSGLDGWDQQNHGRSPENSQSQSLRYRKSRSRSRSRSRGRCWGRVRSRSRSRSWSRGRGRSRSRSPSPLGDFRQESYGCSDRRRGGLGVSSQTCRDYTAGKCRRGSQCRFLHQDGNNQKDGGRLEKDPPERGRHRQSFLDEERDGPPRNLRSPMICQDFLKGRCHRGSSCKYPHHDSSGYNNGRSYRNLSTDHDYKPQPRRSGNIPCKFYMMGKCQRDDCRFSHDFSENGNLEGRNHDRRGRDFDVTDKSWNGPTWDESTSVTDITRSTGWGTGQGASSNRVIAEKINGDRWGHSLDNKNNQWDGPKWDDASGVTETVNSARWGNSNVENVNLIDPTTAEKRDDYRMGCSLNNDVSMSHGSAREDNAAERDENVLPQWVSGSQALSTCVAGSKDVAKSFDGADAPFTPPCFQPQTLQGISKNVHEQNIMQDTSVQQLATSVTQSVFPENPQVLQQQSKVGENNGAADDTNSVNRVDIYGNSRHPAHMPAQSFNQNVGSFGSQPSNTGGLNQSEHNVYANSLNGLNNTNGPLQQSSLPSLQNPVPIQHGESVNTKLTAGMPQNVMNSEQVVQITHLPASLTQIFGNGQLPQLYAALNPPSSKELASSLPDSVSFPPTTSTGALPDPGTVSQKQYDPVGDSSVELTKSGMCTQAPGVLSTSSEPKNPMSMDHSSPLSAGIDPGKLQNNLCTEDLSHKNQELRQQKPVAHSLPVEDSKLIAEKCKPEQENIRAGNGDADAKAGDSGNGKDEKAMRLFKIALVEFVKEMLKPKWKEGQMSREVHKTIVKKVVDKVTCTVQVANIPKTQEKIDQYLSYSKPKLNKLVEAYTERFLKNS